MKKYLSSIVATLGVVLGLGLIAMLALPPLLRPIIERKASAALKREVHLAGVSINPFLFKVSLDQLQIKDRYGEFFSVKTVVVDAELVSIFRGGPVLRELTLTEPKLKIVRLGEAQFNFSDLLQQEHPSEPAAEPLRFALNNIRIVQGNFQLDDRFKGSQQQIDQLDLALPFVSNMPQRIDEYIAPALAGRLNGRPFAIKGQTKPFKDSLDTSLSFNAQNIDITDYLSYTPLPAGLRIAKGQLNTQLDIVFREEKNRATVLLNGKAQIQNLQLQIHQQDALQLGKLDIELSDFKPLLGELHFKKVGIDGMNLIASRDEQGQINWLTMQAPTISKTQRQIASVVSRERAKSDRATTFQLDQIAIKNSQIVWRDQLVKPVFEQTLTDLAITGQNWSTVSAKPFPVQFKAKTSQGAQLELDVKATTLPVKLIGSTALSALQLQDFASYYRAFLQADLRGKLGAKVDFEFQAEPLQYQLKAGEVQLEQLALKLPKQAKPAIEINQFALQGLALDSQSQVIDIARLGSNKAHVDLALLPGQQLDLLTIFPASKNNQAATGASVQNKPWRVKLAELQLDDYALRVEDRNLTKPAPVQLKQIGLNVKNLDTQPGTSAQLKLTAKAGRATSIEVLGPFVPQPFSAQLQLDARSLDAAYMQPYFSRYINVSLASGYVDAKGKLRLNTAPQFSGSYEGNLAVRQLYALDKTSGDDFLKWKSLAINGIKADFSPVKVDVAEIKLDDFFSRLILSPNGRMNLQDIMVADAGEASVTRESTVPSKVDKAAQASVAINTASAPVPIRVGKIQLSKGNIRYSDLLIKPNYTANLTEMGGLISGISSQNDTRAKLDLKGSVDKIAPVQIQGSLNPLAKNIFIDLKGGVKGYELTAASTYAAKYAGYGISKGKLSMDVAYFIENGKLKASNKLFLDQLTLADEPSNSPDATKLPVKFALSLLTDRHGQIKLSLPIEGSLNDPQFKIGAVIWQVIGNVMEKVVTAPFDVLANALSDGPSLSYVTFEPGSVRLNEAANTALQRLTEVLNDRPTLQLEIAGWADAEVDGDGIRERVLRQKMRAIKAAQFGSATESIESESEVAISDAETPALIAAVYAQSKFEKPSNMLGLNKKLPTDEMRALILKNIVVGEQELLALATQRAKRVENALKEAGLPAERIFTTKPLLNPGKALTDKDHGPESRVQFKLQ
ncbi:DUF748 domain-containing protein [Chitinibacter fontanus]|uniref:DUF748 domain-containing protein n=1 Tax=Chitinibacter fontanus TaxID=1737446 RepID=A0A7D5V8I5_9NEIS|nr:DUF748 domain-containing protein [Chitinibacter fontanus]QLI80654.1 DUF748 domain-containing protein [Chitinibacter fontanus]